VSFVVGSSVQVSDSSVSFSAERRRIVPRSSVVCKDLPLISYGFSTAFSFIARNQVVRKTPGTRLQILAPRFDSGRGLHKINELAGASGAAKIQVSTSSVFRL
jgi:hypothetical protein